MSEIGIIGFMKESELLFPQCFQDQTKKSLLLNKLLCLWHANYEGKVWGRMGASCEQIYHIALSCKTWNAR